MNAIILFILIFSAFGYISWAFQKKNDITEAFWTGLNLIPILLISSVGVSTISTVFIDAHLTEISRILGKLPFEAGVIIGTILAPDLGGLPICRELTADPSLVILNGAALTAILGTTVSFQIPVFMSSLKKEEHDTVIHGFLIGIGAVPVGFLVACFLTHVSGVTFLREFIPVFILCAILFIGLLKKPGMTILIVKKLSRVISLIIYAMFFYTMLGLFVPSLAYAPTALVAENSLAIVKSCLIAGGALVLSVIPQRYCPGILRKAGDKLGINETAVIGLILGMTTSVAMLPLFPKMDNKGKLINAAFSVSGAYFLGGQMGYVAAISDSRTIGVYLAAKVVCGVVSVVLVCALWRKRAGS